MVLEQNFLCDLDIPYNPHNIMNSDAYRIKKILIWDVREGNLTFTDKEEKFTMKCLFTYKLQ